jgi:hypothetical protein
MVTEEKVTIPDGMMSLQEGTCLAAATIIRKKSKSGQLTLPEEILTELTGQNLLKSENSDQKSQFGDALKQAIEKNEDLREISGRDGTPRYYSTQSLSETYARILIQKKENPLLLMAEIVRENSAIYPRPVPLDIFRESPFDLTQEEILDCLKKMAEQGEYQDITQTTTSIGTIFLYSTQHLEPDYASSLAEWLDVGQANNP